MSTNLMNLNIDNIKSRPLLASAALVGVAAVYLLVHLTSSSQLGLTFQDTSSRSSSKQTAGAGWPTRPSTPRRTVLTGTSRKG